MDLLHGQVAWICCMEMLHGDVAWVRCMEMLRVLWMHDLDNYVAWRYCMEMLHAISTCIYKYEYMVPPQRSTLALVFDGVACQNIGFRMASTYFHTKIISFHKKNIF